MLKYLHLNMIFEIFIKTPNDEEPFVYQNESNSDKWNLEYFEAREQAILKALELCQNKK